MPEVDRLMRQAVAESVFPGAVLLVAQAGRILYLEAFGCADLATGRRVTTDTVFDLASLTKPLATALAVMVLIQAGALKAEGRLAAVLPEFAASDKAGVTLAQLLSHSSGLPDYRPFYTRLAELPAGSRRPALRRLLVAEPLLYPPGRGCVYSDLGYMILDWVVEKTAGTHLDRFVAEALYAPLGAAPLFFVDLAAGAPVASYAATEICPWRGRLIEAEVHDENAHVLGGVAGHAGLFGTAAAVHRLLAELTRAWNRPSARGLLDPAVVRRFVRREPGTGRALGFDMPADSQPSCGRYFPATSIGHLGFTGTSFWVDLERGLSVILLTNRVHPSRENIAIRAFRPRIHDAVCIALRPLP
jgi:CubicO group peptidase (beta-lactamase class C family)